MIEVARKEVFWSLPQKEVECLEATSRFRAIFSNWGHRRARGPRGSPRLCPPEGRTGRRVSRADVPATLSRSL